MKLHVISSGIGLILAGFSGMSSAEITWGNSDNDKGAFSISGALRANYQDTDYGQSTADQKIKFDAAILRLGYESPDWFGKVEYRCYQYDIFCDFSTLVYAYAGYHLNSTDHITVGVQPIPFGPGRFWDSSFYAGINNTMGLQDVSNLGANYHFELPSQTKVDLAYFAADGGNYHGESRDSARYSANMVKTSGSFETDLEERNMWLARIDQDLNFLSTDDLKISMGASYWYSEIENKNASTEGSRNAWALFNRVNYKNLNIVITVGRQSINNKDTLNPQSSTFGSFDAEYNIANEGYFYTIDTSYVFKNVWDTLNITPYMVFSGYDKKENSFDDSQRNIVGMVCDYKNISLYTEYVLSKNDSFVGGTKDSLAIGDDSKWNKLFNMMFIYKF